MQRRAWSAARISLLAAVLVAGAAAPVASAKDTIPPRPNVVVILADDAGLMDFGAYGGDLDQTDQSRPFFA